MLDVLGVYKVKATYTYFDNNSVEVPVVGTGDVECKKVAWERGVIAGFVDVDRAGDGSGLKATTTNQFIINAKGYHTDWASETWAMGDGDAYLSIAVPYTKKGVTVYEGFGYTVDEVVGPKGFTMEGPKEFEDYTIQTSNENIVIVSENQGNAQDYGYYKITANQVGSCLLIVKGIYTDDNFNRVEKAIGTVRVEVKPERKVNSFNVTKDGVKLNVAYMFDSVTYKLGIADQYGEALDMGDGEKQYGTYTVKQIGKLDATTNAVVETLFSAPDVTLDAEGTATGLTNSTLVVTPDSFVTDSVKLDKQYPIRFDFVFKDKTGKEFKASVPQFVVGNENEAKKYELYMEGGNAMDTAVYEDSDAVVRILGLIGKTKSNFNFYGPNYVVSGGTLKTKYDTDNLYFEERKLNDLKWSEVEDTHKIDIDPATGSATVVNFVYNIMLENKYVDAKTINSNGEKNFVADDNKFISAIKSATGAAVKLKSGTYRITAYELKDANTTASTVDKVRATKISQVSFVVSDSQSKPVVKKVDEGERITDVHGNNVLEAFNVSLANTKEGWKSVSFWTPDVIVTNYIPAIDGRGYELNFDTNLDEPETTAYVKTATVRIHNEKLGYVDVTTAVDKIVKAKKN
jgi:hypothetical protein